MSDIQSLFSSCVKVILGSIRLLSTSTVILPKNVAQYILFEACTMKNFRAVEAVVESWPHSDLSFDFMQNSFCRRNKEQSQFCIEAHDYYNEHSTYQFEECVSSIVLGLFNNLHANLKESDIPVIKVVDLSKIRVADDLKG